jgi:predicted HAD superfamily phosphohydrolase YqeG
MLHTLFYTLSAAWTYRDALRTAARTQQSLLGEIPFQQLKQQGVTTIVFDFDGVLASHKKQMPEDAGIACLNLAREHFDRLYILSNKPTPARQAYFKRYYPDITFITAVRKKPYPDGLLAIAKQENTALSTVCLVDDRLLTGVLASLVAGTRIVYITDPLIDREYRPFHEWVFQCIRKTERALFRGKV